MTAEVTRMEFGIPGPPTVRQGRAVVMLPAGGQRVALAALLLRAGQVVAVDELRIGADLHRGRHAEVIAEAQVLAAEYPLRERLHGPPILALDRDGRQAEALAAYQAARTALIEELGVGPRPGLAELHPQILNAGPVLWLPRVPAVAEAENLKAGRPAPRGRLAARRRAVGLTQEDLAARLRIERSTVVRWERGTTRPLPWLQPKLAQALRVSASRLADLLGGPAPVGADDGGPAPAPIPRQLPAAVADFTGRTGELAALTRMLDRAAAGAPGTVVTGAIGGTAGVGKTALALHWAHQVAGKFPGGQLHANLRGFDPAGPPVTPAQVIRGFLDALGVPPERIPVRLDAQAGLYRSLLADKRMLIVLDNALDEQQVRPLLPASPASLVLVTSRNQLAGLAADGARLVTLGVLSHGEAVQLLSARLGAARAAAEPGAVAEIAGLCMGLPLALAVAAARAAARPTFPLAALAAELHDTTGRPVA